MNIMRYKNITLLVLSILLASWLSGLEIFNSYLLGLGELGYIGAFIAGIFFVSTFTVAESIVVLLIISRKLSAVEISLIAAMGAVVGDLLIFRFIKDGLIREVAPIYRLIGGKRITQILHSKSKYMKWLLPIIGTIIIASPLPDEMGISLMGASKLKTYQFLLLTFILNAVGIFLFISASKEIR